MICRSCCRTRQADHSRWAFRIQASGKRQHLQHQSLNLSGMTYCRNRAFHPRWAFRSQVQNRVSQHSLCRSCCSVRRAGHCKSACRNRVWHKELRSRSRCPCRYSYRSCCSILQEYHSSWALCSQVPCKSHPAALGSRLPSACTRRYNTRWGHHSRTAFHNEPHMGHSGAAHGLSSPWHYWGSSPYFRLEQPQADATCRQRKWSAEDAQAN